LDARKENTCTYGKVLREKNPKKKIWGDYPLIFLPGATPAGEEEGQVCHAQALVVPILHRVTIRGQFTWYRPPGSPLKKMQPQQTKDSWRTTSAETNLAEGQLPQIQVARGQLQQISLSRE
jgi:hypothetical protein